jgi:hypothetical protein
MEHHKTIGEREEGDCCTVGNLQEGICTEDESSEQIAEEVTSWRLTHQERSGEALGNLGDRSSSLPWRRPKRQERAADVSRIRRNLFTVQGVATGG